MIKLRDITKSYSNGKEDSTVLKELNLDLEDGKFYSLLGPSGCGKSTLLNILGFLDSDFTGNYIINGDKINYSDNNELYLLRRKYVGFIFQSFNLIEYKNSLENVALPLEFIGYKKKQRREMALEALRMVGLEDKGLNLPSQLSGGQKQRVSIARAIVSKPSLILADEPSGALDVENGLKIIELINELRLEHNLTVLMVTHDINMTYHSDRIFKIFNGKIK